MPEQSSAWNRHHKVGGTLLENWVEERAVGDKTIQEERSNITKLSKNGHTDLLYHAPYKNLKAYDTTTKDAYSKLHRIDPSASTIGKRRQMLEQELMKQAAKQVLPDPIDPKSHFLTTSHADYAHEDVFPPSRPLGTHNLTKGSTLPDAEVSKKFARPITYWSDFAGKGSGTAICSTNTELLHAESHGTREDLTGVHGFRLGQVHQNEASLVAVNFGKHASFSTPIEEFKRSCVKE